jgi:hypothetical protein
MQPEPARTRLNRSALAGLLTELALVDPPPAPPSFVDGLAQWLGWKEAIPLSAALQTGANVTNSVTTPVTKSAATSRAPDKADSSHTAALEFQRVQQALLRAIADPTATAVEDGASFVPFRRRYFSLQQAMETQIAPLRNRLRGAVAALPTPATARLAALDAAVAEALAAREQTLLALMPVLLEKHFSRLRQSAPAHAAAPGPASPLSPLRKAAPPWLATFNRDMQRLLLAELDLRLQPALGLLDTLQAAHPNNTFS